MANGTLQVDVWYPTYYRSSRQESLVSGSAEEERGHALGGLFDFKVLPIAALYVLCAGVGAAIGGIVLIEWAAEKLGSPIWLGIPPW